MPSPPEGFLQSFFENTAEKNYAAMPEPGTFSTDPVPGDLQGLTIEAKDIDDLKDCVAGNCKVKLSAAMIDRFHREVNWNASDYRQQATALFKEILLNYVRDYRAHGDVALIEYNDKAN